MAINPLSPNAVAQALFKRNDTTKTGKLTEGQFADALAQAHGKPKADAAALTQAKQVFAQLDADQDGGLDITEFEQANVEAQASVQNAGTNLYQALQTAGVASSNADSNIYTNLLYGSLNGTFNQTGSLVGQLVGGAVTSKLA